jgi:hypothetical protein
VWRLLLDRLKVNHFDQAEDHRQCSQRGVRVIVYARGAPAIRNVVVPTWVIILLGLYNPPRSWIGTVGPSLLGLTIAPCVDSLLFYTLIRRPKSILWDNPKIWGTCMHLYNYIWVVLLVPRLNLSFLSPKLSRGIDKVLVCLYSCGFDNPRILLGESCYNWHPYACGLFCWA